MEEEIDSLLSFRHFLGKNRGNDNDGGGRDENRVISEKELDLYYTIANSACRRKCVILSNNTFTSRGLGERTWTKSDVQMLQLTFEQLKFTVKLHENLNYKETIELIQTESKSADNKDVDCFVLIILSHPVALHHGKLEFQCTDKSLSVELVVDQLTKPSATLAGKPKCIFIEASSYSESESTLPRSLAHDGQSLEGKSRQYRIPRYADCLLLYLTSNVSQCSLLQENGSETIRLLCETLRNYSHECDLMTMLTFLADGLQKASEASNSQRETALVQVMSTLTRLVHFHHH